LKECSKVDRVTLPLLKTLDLLLTNNIFAGMDESPADGSTSFAELAVEAVRSEIRGSGDVTKIIAAMHVFLGLLQYEAPTRTRAFEVLP
jgi:hypothetical protein